MVWNGFVKFINYSMKMYNFLIYTAISIIIANTTYLISYSQEARAFLEKIECIPMKPIWVVSGVIINYILLVIVMELIRIKKGNTKIVIIFYGIEIIICLTLMYIVNMSYSGIILVVVADILTYMNNKKYKAILLSIMLSIYILCDYDFISLRLNIISFSQYLTYYNKSIQSYLLGLKSMAIAINSMIFILYMITLIRIQSDENKRIKILNKKLNEANEELSLMNIKLKDYAKTNEKMAETRERNRLAREIHDTIGHNLTGIIAGIDACTTMMDYDPNEVKSQLTIISDVARQGINEVRRSVRALRPDALENLSLEDAIKRMISDISKTAKVNVEFNKFIDDFKFNTDEEDAIYRVIQEGITNSIRHGKATNIRVNVKKDNEILKIEIEDNGIGCKEVKKGFGLQHIKEQINLLNGDIYYNGEKGFILIVSIPIRWRNNI